MCLIGIVHCTDSWITLPNRNVSIQNLWIPIGNAHLIAEKPPRLKNIKKCMAKIPLPHVSFT